LCQVFREGCPWESRKKRGRPRNEGCPGRAEKGMPTKPKGPSSNGCSSGRKKEFRNLIERRNKRQKKRKRKRYEMVQLGEKVAMPARRKIG